MGRPAGSRTARPLTPAMFHILLALAAGERHGYAIMREVEVLTGGAQRLGPGSLYGSIKRMLADGLIEECGERPAGTEARRLEVLVVAARGRRLLGRAEGDG